jgi:hypothetical protein
MMGEGSERVGAATRPASVVWYERLAVAAFAATLASAAANRIPLRRDMRSALRQFDSRQLVRDRYAL